MKLILAIFLTCSLARAAVQDDIARAFLAVITPLVFHMEHAQSGADEPARATGRSRVDCSVGLAGSSTTKD